MAPKVKKNSPPPKSDAISIAKAVAQTKAKALINFSFKYLDNDTEEFQFGQHNSSYFMEFLTRIKNLCALTPLELHTNRSGALKAHPIDWPDTIKTGFGFPKEEEIVDTPYQFSLTKNEYGRIHGFFIEPTFYIVWLDKDHLLYPKNKIHS